MVYGDEVGFAVAGAWLSLFVVWTLASLSGRGLTAWGVPWGGPG